MLIHNKPKSRGTFRRILGKEFFILRRKYSDWGHRAWARPLVSATEGPSVSLIRHQSPLIRKLRSVDMQLQYNKVVNLKLALEKTGSVLIRPGETYSFWKLVGKPRRKKGYLEGLVLREGKIDRGIGGGVCQLGNLIYWMLLHTSLTVTERWRHGYDVFPDVNREIPFGCGATLSYNYIDLRFQNNTPHAYLLKVWMDDVFLRGEILCDVEEANDIRIIETDHRFESLWWGGYQRCNKIWRKLISKATQEERVEMVTENIAVLMYEPLLKGNE